MRHNKQKVITSTLSNKNDIKNKTKKENKTRQKTISINTLNQLKNNEKQDVPKMITIQNMIQNKNVPKTALPVH